MWELNSPAKYYHVVDIRIAPADSINKFPHPAVFLRVLDTKHTHIVVRFPELGLLGIQEDTVTKPFSTTGDTLFEYKSHEPVYLLNFPKTEYFLFIDVWSSDGTKLLDSRPFEFDMNTEPFRAAHLSFNHAPTTGMGSPTLRRRFHPTLLPLSIETNPGWSATETLDSNVTYALAFHDPTEPRKLELSLTMHPADVGVIDSAMWNHLKIRAETAFGARGVATSTIGDFQVADSASRRIIKTGYEFISEKC